MTQDFIVRLQSREELAPNVYYWKNWIDGESVGSNLPGYARFDGLSREASFVYCFRSIQSGLYKIGVADNLRDRERQIRCSCGSTLKLVAAIVVIRETRFEIERCFHQDFADYRTQGEWFDLEEMKIREEIAKCPDLIELARKALPCISLQDATRFCKVKKSILACDREIASQIIDFGQYVASLDPLDWLNPVSSYSPDL